MELIEMARVYADLKCVGNYLLGKSIGEGTYGKVTLAIHQPTGEKVHSTIDLHTN